MMTLRAILTDLERITAWRSPLLLSVAGLFLLVVPDTATAQAAPELEEIRASVQAGETVRVTDADGKRTTGRFEGILGDSVRLIRNGQTTNTPVSSIQLIEQRHSERWWKGALLGASPGLTYMSLIAVIHGSGCDATYCAGPGVTMSLLGAGIGVMIASAIPRYDAVYRRPVPVVRIDAVPLLSKDRKGVAFAVKF